MRMNRYAIAIPISDTNVLMVNDASIGSIRSLGTIVPKDTDAREALAATLSVSAKVTTKVEEWKKLGEVRYGTKDIVEVFTIRSNAIDFAHSDENGDQLALIQREILLTEEFFNDYVVIDDEFRLYYMFALRNREGALNIEYPKKET